MNQVRLARTVNLPSGWRSRAIGELHTGDVPLLTPLDFQNESFLHFSIPSYQEAENPAIEKGKDIRSTKLAIPQHCVLFGKLNPRVQKVWNVHTDSALRLVASTEWLPIVTVASVDQDFVYYLMWSDWVMPLAQTLVTGSTPSRQRVNPEAFYNIEVPIPPLEEQCAISWALGQVRDAIRVQDISVTTAQALKRAAMRRLFTRGLRGEAQRETEVGPVPEGWDVVLLEDCAVVQTGAAKGRKFGGAEVVQVPYLRVANVQDGYLDLSEVKTITIRKSELNRYRLQQGDVLMTEGGDFDKLGRGFIWRGQLKLCVHQNHVFAVRTDRNRLLPDFFAYEAQSDYGKAYFLKVAHKTTNLASINTTKLKAFPVLIPTLGEQREMVSILEAIDRKIDLHQRKRAVLEELFRALLHKLMTGEVRVGELGVRPSSDETCQATPQNS